MQEYTGDNMEQEVTGMEEYNADKLRKDKFLKSASSTGSKSNASKNTSLSFLSRLIPWASTIWHIQVSRLCGILECE